MGNKQCCQSYENEEYKHTFPEEGLKQVSLKKPEEGAGPASALLLGTAGPSTLSTPVKKRLEHYSAIERAAQESQQGRQFGKELYVGQLDSEGKHPQGTGEIYKADGSVYLGEWREGKANGRGVYIMKDGSYYEGNFSENQAESLGKFYSGEYQYEGHFASSQFHGIGTQKDPNHSFHGEFDRGRKTQGTFTWHDDDFDYEYTGQFNADSQFEGKGVLREPNGVYEGQFVKGEKQGQGVYSFSNGLKYEGEYRAGLKRGTGTIFNCNDSVAYTGDFYDDLPHGEGFVFDGEGNRLKRKWVNGLDAEGIDAEYL